MASTYSNSLRLELIATGEQAGTWGSTTNRNMGTLLEQAIAGYEVITISGDTTLTTNNGQTDQSRNMVLDIQGTIATTANIYIPAQEKLYVVKNGTTGGQSIAVRTTGPTGTSVTIPNGKTTILYGTGSNVYTALTFADDLDIDNINFTGNTISSTDTNGNINLNPNGTGSVVLSKDVTANQDLTVSANLAVNGNTTLGDASGDTTTINGNAVSIPNGLNFDTNTLVLDQANNRVGIGQANPSAALHVANRTITDDFTIGGTGGYQFPSSSGTSEQILQMNSSGNLQFVDIGTIGAWSTVGNAISGGANSMTIFGSVAYDVWWATYRLLFDATTLTTFRVGLVDSAGNQVSASNIFNSTFIYQDVSGASGGAVTSNANKSSNAATGVIAVGSVPSSASTEVVVEGTMYLFRNAQYSSGNNFAGNAQSTCTKDGGATGDIGTTSQCYIKEASANATAVYGLVFSELGGNTLKSGSRIDLYGASFPT